MRACWGLQLTTGDSVFEFPSEPPKAISSEVSSSQLSQANWSTLEFDFEVIFLFMYNNKK